MADGERGSSEVYRYQGIDIAGRRAIVTGGTSGIGQALALGLAQEGAHVVPTSRRRDAVAEAAERIEAKGVKSLALTCDVRDRESVEDLVATARREWGGIDILVNAAGTIARSPLEEMTDDEWQTVTETNLTGTFLTNQAVGRAMIEQGSGGRIINIASMTSFASVRHVAGYAASKGGVLQFTKTAAHEWAPHGITVNAVAPGFFITEINADTLEPGSPRRTALERETPAGRLGEVDELVGAVVYLASDAARFTNGTCLVVDGGFLARAID